MTTKTQANPFQRATKDRAKLRMSIIGPSGSGKTYTSLRVATALTPGKVALIDTEHGSASKYADEFDFDVVEMAAPFHPDRYVKAMGLAADAGYETLIIDSLSHAWNGPGGLLEIVDDIAAQMKSSNSFAAWKDATPIQNRLIEALISAPLHIIGCMRSKTEYVVETNDKGKVAPRKVGTAPIQRDGFEYEFDVVGEMNLDNEFLVSKSRCRKLNEIRRIKQPGDDLAEILREWLEGSKNGKPETEEGI